MPALCQVYNPVKYFVLRPSLKDWHGKASIAAVETYMQKAREAGETELAEDLRQWVALIKAGIATKGKE